MPYLVTKKEDIEGALTLPAGEQFRCKRCGSDYFIQDAFNPYYTAPDRAGWYYFYLLAKCGKCGRLHRWTMLENTSDGMYPGRADRETSTMDPGANTRQ